MGQEILGGSRNLTIFFRFLIAQWAKSRKEKGVSQLRSSSLSSKSKQRKGRRWGVTGPMPRRGEKRKLGVALRLEIFKAIFCHLFFGNISTSVINHLFPIRLASTLDLFLVTHAALSSLLASLW